MSKYSLFTILAINSTTIDLFVVEKNQNYTHFVYSKQTSYSGYKNYNFVDAKQLFTLIPQIILQCENTLNFTINNFSVVLPQRFFRTTTRERTKLLKGKAVTLRDNKKLLGSFFATDSGFSPVSLTPTLFKVDSQKFAHTPLGVSGDTYLINIQQLALENSVEELFSTCAKSLSKKIKYFASTSLVFNQYNVDNLIEKSIWVNINEKSTDISLCSDNQILSTTAVEWGGDFLHLALADMLEIDAQIAKGLTSKLNFNLPLEGNNKYVLGDRANSIFDQVAVNKHAITTLYFIIKQINDAIMTITNNAKLPIYFFGHEICNIKGIKEILENFLEADINLIASNKINQTKIDIVTHALLDNLVQSP